MLYALNYKSDHSRNALDDSVLLTRNSMLKQCLLKFNKCNGNVDGRTALRTISIALVGIHVQYILSKYTVLETSTKFKL